MFNLFKKNDDSPKDVKTLRDALLQFVKEQLQKAEGGEGSNIKTINIFIFCGPAEKHIYEAAVYAGEKDKFKNEVQKIADDYALDLPVDWELEISYDKDYPPEAIKAINLDAAIAVRAKEIIVQKPKSAYIRVLNGEAEKLEYPLAPADGKITIGRGKSVQVDGGYFRLNAIAFDAESKDQSNKFISRQHAHIEWNREAGCFMVFADDGGVPPHNKVKVRSALNENIIKLNTIHIGHKLTEGDQVILGESAVLEFSYRPK